jgi:hypothetical protein
VDGRRSVARLKRGVATPCTQLIADVLRVNDTLARDRLDVGAGELGGYRASPRAERVIDRFPTNAEYKGLVDGKLQVVESLVYGRYQRLGAAWDALACLNDSTDRSLDLVRRDRARFTHQALQVSTYEN